MKNICSSLAEALFAALPHLRALSDDHWGDWEGEEIGDYLVFEGVFARRIQSLLGQEQGGERNRELERSFAVVERLAQQGEQTATEMVLAVIDWLVPDEWVVAYPFMGAATRRSLDHLVIEHILPLRDWAARKALTGDSSRWALDNIDRAVAVHRHLTQPNEMV